MYREKLTMHYHIIYGNAAEVAYELGIKSDSDDKAMVAWNDPKHFYEWDYETFSTYSEMVEFVNTFA